MVRKKEYVERETIHGNGIYCFYPFDLLDSKKKGCFKIGLTTTEFDKRIRSYHTYLPQGMFYVAFLKNPENKTDLPITQFYRKIEKEIFDKVKELGAEVIEMPTRKKNNGETEWFYTDEKTIETAFDFAYKKYKGRYTKLEIGTLGHLNRLKPKLERESIFKGEIYF